MASNTSNDIKKLLDQQQPEHSTCIARPAGTIDRIKSLLDEDDYSESRNLRNSNRIKQLLHQTNFESLQHLDSNNTSLIASSQSNYERSTNNDNRLPSISDMMSESMA